MINEALALQHWLITECEHLSWRFHSVKHLAPHGQTTRTSSCTVVCLRSAVGISSRREWSGAAAKSGGGRRVTRPGAPCIQGQPPSSSRPLNEPPLPLSVSLAVAPRRDVSYGECLQQHRGRDLLYSTTVPLFPCSTSTVPYSLLLNVGWFEPKQSSPGWLSHCSECCWYLLIFWRSSRETYEPQQ